VSDGGGDGGVFEIDDGVEIGRDEIDDTTRMTRMTAP
jgi:hypothetical protein